MSSKNKTGKVEEEAEKYFASKKDKLFFETNDILIFNDDFLKTDCIEENSINLMVTSPPYNVDIRYNSYNDKTPYEIYLEFTEKWLEKAYRLAMDDGLFCINIPLDKNKGGQQSVYAGIVTICHCSCRNDFCFL
ncbi:MAG: DNA methyltransferase [Candidatus Aminicenantia bacterium]